MIMYGYKYVSKKEKWVSNDCGGTVLKRTYKYDNTNKLFTSLIENLIIKGIAKVIMKAKERRK